MGYTDVNFSGCPDDRKSTSGYVGWSSNFLKKCKTNSCGLIHYAGRICCLL